MADPGKVTNQISDKPSFDEWYEAYNAVFTFTDVDQTRPIDFEKGIAPLIRKGIDDETLIVIKDFKAKIPTTATDGTRPMPEAEIKRRMSKFKDLLHQAFAEGAMDEEMSVVWGDSALDDIPFTGNAVGVGSDGAEDSVSEIVGAGVVSALNPTDVGLESFGFFCGVTRDAQGNVNGSTNSFDTTYEFPLLRDFINAHVEIYANRTLDNVDAFFSKLLGDWSPTEKKYESLEDKTEAAAVSGSLAGLDAAIAGQGQATDISEGKTDAELRQCALMSIFFDDKYNLKDDASYSSRSEEEETTDSGTKFEKLRYWKRGRIIPLDMSGNKKIDQMANYFYSDQRIRSFFAQQNQSLRMNKDLFYVYEDKDGTMKEVKLKKSSSALNKELQTTLEDLQHQIQEADNGITPLSPQDRSVVEAKIQQLGTSFRKENSDLADLSKFFQYFRLDNITIDYNGTNPSTARNDVKVTLKFTCESYASLDADLSPIIYPKGTDPNEGRTIKLRDLVITPIDDDGSGNLISALKNSYDPSRNRIRLKLQSTQWKEGYAFPAGGGPLVNGSNTKYFTPPMILDLATINHSLTRNAESSAVTFTVEYRGYMQSLMQQPFADVLVNDAVLQNRKLRAENIKTIIDKGCSKETLRELLRVERNTSEEESKKVFMTIYSALYKNNAFRVASFSHKNYSTVLRNLPLAGKNHFISKITRGTAWYSQGFTDSYKYLAGTETLPKQLAKAAEKGEVPSAVGFKINQMNRCNFVYLGDLILAVSRNIYKNNKDSETVDQLKNNLRFITCPIDIPDPGSSTGYRRINPVEIPVEMFFFSEWFHEVIVKKDLKFYPISAFIRDLVERLINNLLFEVCMSTLLPDEKPPTLRVSYFSSNSIKKSDGGHDVYRSVAVDSTNNKGIPLAGYNPPKYGYLDMNGHSYPLFKNEANFDSGNDPVEVNQCDYIVIYSNLPPYKRELNSATNNDELRSLPEIPTLVHGLFCQQGISMIDSTSLTKTDSPFLREARYFNNNFGSLALMNTVYDLSFEINDDNANTYLYPGMLINVIIADFAGSGIEASSYEGTDNDPHVKRYDSNGNLVAAGTPAHYLGIGGYFIIKSVSYNIGVSSKKYAIKVECKFLGTEADTIVKQSNQQVRDIVASDQKVCLDAYNNAVKINQSTIQFFNDNKDSDEQEKESQFSQISPQAPNSTQSGNPAVTQVPQTTPQTVTAPDLSVWKSNVGRIIVAGNEETLYEGLKGTSAFKQIGAARLKQGKVYIKYKQTFPGTSPLTTHEVLYEIHYNPNSDTYTSRTVSSAPTNVTAKENNTQV